MAEVKCTDPRTPKLFRRIAIGLALVWAVWWTLFVLVLGIVGQSPFGILAQSLAEEIFYSVLFSLILLLSVVIAWKWRVIGGFLLVSESLPVIIFICLLMTTGHFPIRTFILVLLTVALPPLISGYLFIASWARSRKPK